MPTQARVEPLLQVRDVSKSFPGVRALDRVSFDLRPGEVHALVGENGAGKSTLMHLLAGVHAPDEGVIWLDGRPVEFADEHAAMRAGIGVVFQEGSLSSGLSIAENVFACRQPTTRLGLIDRRELRHRTIELLDLFEWHIDPETQVRELTPAGRQVVEILKALSTRPRVLILDEPTSSLTAVETEYLFRNMRRVTRAGVGCIYISHHLSEIFAIADRATVLRDGRRVATCDVAAVTESDLIRRMVGRDLADVYGPRQSESGTECLRVERLCWPGAFEDISLSVRHGEIVGLAGLAGAGRTELARAIIGADATDAGGILLDGQAVIVRSPGDAIRHGIAYLTESRKEDGLFLDMTVRENSVAPRLGAFAGRTGLMDELRVTRFAEELRARFHVATAGVDQRARQLSGGNQQKVLLGAWLGTRPRVLIADEPTRGVDVVARSDLYHTLRDLASDGTAILLISSDLPELLGMCDRILVMQGGRLVGEFSRWEATEEVVTACAAGIDAQAVAGHQA